MDLTENKGLATPCFVFDEDEFERSVRGFRKALDSNFENAVIGYSVKTNSLPYVVSKAGTLGCYAEVVSCDEYDLARLVGYPVDKIIYNGPMKSKETFLEAITCGAIVNIETKREIDWLADLPKSSRFKVGLRLNIDINGISPADAKKEDDFSRFGFSDQNNEFQDALSRIGRLRNVDMAGLHIHRMSATRSTRYYENLIGYAAKVIERHRLNLEYLDIGGGYYGVFPGAPTYDEYADAFSRALDTNGLKHLKVIVEPGTALIASAMYYESSVIDVKDLPGRRIVVTDGTRNDVDPLFTKKNYIKQILFNQREECRLPLQVVTGSSCMENDCLFELNGETELRVGDRIRYNNVGSYTMCLSPNFINYLPVVYAKAGGGYKIIREKWTAADMAAKSVIIAKDNITTKQ